LLCNHISKPFKEEKYDPPKEKLFNIHLQSGIKISFELLPEQLPAFIKKLEGSHESDISL
jgi:hypothetical protein